MLSRQGLEYPGLTLNFAVRLTARHRAWCLRPEKCPPTWEHGASRVDGEDTASARARQLTRSQPASQLSCIGNSSCTSKDRSYSHVKLPTSLAVASPLERSLLCRKLPIAAMTDRRATPGRSAEGQAFHEAAIGPIDTGSFAHHVSTAVVSVGQLLIFVDEAVWEQSEVLESAVAGVKPSHYFTPQSAEDAVVIIWCLANKTKQPCRYRPVLCGVSLARRLYQACTPNLAQPEPGLEWRLQATGQASLSVNHVAAISKQTASPAGLVLSLGNRHSNSVCRPARSRSYSDISPLRSPSRISITLGRRTV